LANHKSALKRAVQSEKKNARNKTVKTKVKNSVKTILQSATENASVSAEDLNSAKSVIHKAAKKGVIHKRTAARKISRLTKLANSVSA